MNSRKGTEVQATAKTIRLQYIAEADRFLISTSLPTYTELLTDLLFIFNMTTDQLTASDSTINGRAASRLSAAGVI